MKKNSLRVFTFKVNCQINKVILIINWEWMNENMRKCFTKILEIWRVPLTLKNAQTLKMLQNVWPKSRSETQPRWRSTTPLMIYPSKRKIQRENTEMVNPFEFLKCNNSIRKIVNLSQKNKRLKRRRSDFDVFSHSNIMKVLISNTLWKKLIDFTFSKRINSKLNRTSCLLISDFNY